MKAPNPRSRFQPSWVALAASLAVLRPAGASASPAYPEELQAALGLGCPPRCTLCHQDRQGGVGTVKSASFGETLISVSELGADDAATLRCALELLAPECDSEVPPACAAPDQQCLVADSDADGSSDIDELRAGRDPNVDGEGLLCGVSYGCGAELRAPEEQRGALHAWACGALAMSVFVFGRWRRRSSG